MTKEGLAKPWLDFEAEFGERLLLTPPIATMAAQYMQHGAAIASKYTLPAPDPSVKTDDTTTDDGTQVRIYTPDGYKGGRPVCIYYHGGGWAMGDVISEDAYSCAISKAGGIVVISVDYKLAPQNAHPGLLDECYKALQWARNNSQRLNTAHDKFLLAGLSAGGQIAFGTALRAVDDGLGEQLVGVLGINPVTVHPDGVPAELKERYTAMEQHDGYTINTNAAMRAFWDAFGAPPTDPYGSPLLHPKLKHLNKVWMAVSGHDTLRDDGLLMKEKLDQAGVPNQLDFYEGYPHVFMFSPSPKLEEPRQRFFSGMAEGVRFVLG